MLLEAEKLSVVRQGRALLDSVSVSAAAGELVGVVGPNGAGKSTLLAALAGINKIEGGSITLDGTRLTSLSPAQRGRLLAWVEQTGPVEWPLSVARLVLLGRRPHLGAWQSVSTADQQLVDDVLLETDCHHLRDRDVTTLSGGERTRVLLARALATKPRILLADEPAAALDLGHQLQTMELLRRFADEDRCCLVVLHDLALAARYCDRLYMLCDGQIAANGTPASVLNQQTLQTVYGVEVVIGEVSADAGASGLPWLVPVRCL